MLLLLCQKTGTTRHKFAAQVQGVDDLRGTDTLNPRIVDIPAPGIVMDYANNASQNRCDHSAVYQTSSARRYSCFCDRLLQCSFRIDVGYCCASFLLTGFLLIEHPTGFVYNEINCV